jgi:MFS family permease
MGDVGTGERPSRASRLLSASQKAARAASGAARASAAGVHGTGRVVHRMTAASGAGRTGLSTLLELSISSAIGDAFVVIALAGTLFFGSTADQARGHAAFALIVTIAPYAILAPLVGPMLDRVRRGNKYILMGTLLARGLLCWGMAGAVEAKDVATLLPAALGVLVLQKAYAVTKAAVTPRLLPPEMALVSANSRFSLASLLSTSAGAAVALGIDKAFGDHSGGSAWVLRVATIIYLAAVAIGFRLPDRVDDQSPDEAPDDLTAQPPARDDYSQYPPTVPYPTADQWPPEAHRAGGNGAATAQTAPNDSRPGPPPGSGGPPFGAGRPAATRRRPFAIPHVGPLVAEAMRANAAIRLFYGFMITFLAFILRTEKFGHISDKVALGGLAVAIAAGGILGTGIGSALRARAPKLLMFAVLMLTTLATAACAIMFGLTALLLAALVAAIAQTLVKASLDSILQREIPEETRASVFAFSETVHQLALVVGGLIGLALSLTNSGQTGLTLAAVGLALALIWLLLSRRQRVMRGESARLHS